MKSMRMKSKRMKSERMKSERMKSMRMNLLRMKSMRMNLRRKQRKRRREKRKRKQRKRRRRKQRKRRRRETKVMKRTNIVISSSSEVGGCRVLKCNNDHYQVTTTHSQYNVSFEDLTCTCRRWQLTGNPCCHTLACLGFMKRSPLEFVHSCYSVNTFKRVYAPTIFGINGAGLWGDTGIMEPLPPNFGRDAGRPRCQRKRADALQRAEAENSSHVVDEDVFESQKDDDIWDLTVEQNDGSHLFDDPSVKLQVRRSNATGDNIDDDAFMSLMSRFEN